MDEQQQSVGEEDRTEDEEVGGQGEQDGEDTECVEVDQVRQGHGDRGHGDAVPEGGSGDQHPEITLTVRDQWLVHRGPRRCTGDQQRVMQREGDDVVGEARREREGMPSLEMTSTWIDTGRIIRGRVGGGAMNSAGGIGYQ